MATPYNPDIHTFAALGEQLAANSEQGALLAGSLGRAAYLGATEFDARGQHPLYHDTLRGVSARDIDYIGYVWGKNGPFPVDVDGFANPEVSLRREGTEGAWVLRREGAERAKIDYDVMRPVEGHLLLGGQRLEANVSTLALSYMLLNLMEAPQRPQDKLATRLLARQMRDSDWAELNSAGFQPLRSLARRNGHKEVAHPRESRKWLPATIRSRRPA